MPGKDSAELRKAVKILERRQTWLEDLKPDKNSYDLAEIAALDLLLDFVDANRKLILEFMKGE